MLAARDGRDREFHRALADPEAGAAGAFLVLSTNLPGAVKQRPGLALLAHAALERLVVDLDLQLLVSGCDLLGPYHLGWCRQEPRAAKDAALLLESQAPAGRLLDIDVYRPDGVQVDRASLGLPARACLVCAEPARECILLQRHSAAELQARVQALLQPWSRVPERLAPARLALALEQGARRELELTPKPGLVDRHDSGSHRDLSYASMLTSVQLLPCYFQELLQCAAGRLPLEASVRAGRAAETRMFQAIGCNGHKGYLFLAGIVLMAACACRGEVALLRAAIIASAARFFRDHPGADQHGAQLRAVHGLGSLREEVAQGLPAVFEHGWPKYRQALDAGWTREHAGFYLMAVLMQQVQDSTSLRRCGPGGLERLRRDGALLQRLLEARTEAPEPFLAELNEAYRALNLTMGGVADCMALTFALHYWQ